MTMHFIIRFEPPPENEAAFREALVRVAGPTQAEPGCVSWQALESLSEPRVFAIHSVWADETAFDLHAQLPHTVRFIETAEKLLGKSVQGLRLRQIG